MGGAGLAVSRPRRLCSQEAHVALWWAGPRDLLYVLRLLVVFLEVRRVVIPPFSGPVMGFGHHVGDVAAQYVDVGAELCDRLMAGGYLIFAEGGALLFFDDVPLKPVEFAGVAARMILRVFAEEADFVRCREKSLLCVDKVCLRVDDGPVLLVVTDLFVGVHDPRIRGSALNNCGIIDYAVGGP
jgi:hypothetical protein